MIVKFFKTNWFYIGLLLLALAAARKHFRAGPGESGAPGHATQTEKYTAGPRAKQEGVSLFGGIPDGSARPPRRLPDIEAATAEAFLRRFGKVTPGEQQKFGVPASVLLAAAYVNSFGGTRETAGAANNFYALPCGGDWQGRTATFDERCYRHYERPWDSFRDFSRLLAAQSWFAGLKQSAGRDWQAWVKGLDDKGLSDVEHFGAEMEKVIRAYRLFELDGQ